MSRRSEKRLPWEDLERAVEVPIKDPAQFSKPNRFDLARFFNVEVTTIDRWRNFGIPMYSADTVAVKCAGLHPSLIWTNWFDL
jgi:hypothetical protein